jgi:phage-related protein
MTLSKTTTRLGVQDKTTVDSDKQLNVYGNSSNQLDLGLMVVTDQEFGQLTLSPSQ